MSLSVDLLKLFKSGAGADITFMVKGAGRGVRGHRVVISARCEILGRLLEHEKGHEIELENTTPDALREFMEYLYTDTCTVTSENAVEIAKLAHMYHMHDMFNSVVQDVIKLCTPKTCLSLWIAAHESCIPELIEPLEKYAMANFFPMRATFQNKDLLLECPELMMQLITSARCEITPVGRHRRG